MDQCTSLASQSYSTIQEPAGRGSYHARLHHTYYTASEVKIYHTKHVVRSTDGDTIRYDIIRRWSIIYSCTVAGARHRPSFPPSLPPPFCFLLKSDSLSNVEWQIRLRQAVTAPSRWVHGPLCRWSVPATRHSEWTYMARPCMDWSQWSQYTGLWISVAGSGLQYADWPATEPSLTIH